VGLARRLLAAFRLLGLVVFGLVVFGAVGVDAAEDLGDNPDQDHHVSQVRS